MRFLNKLNRAFRIHKARIIKTDRIKENLYEITATKDKNPPITCQYQIVDLETCDGDIVLANARYVLPSNYRGFTKYLCYVKKDKITFVNRANLLNLPAFPDTDDEENLIIQVNLKDERHTTIFFPNTNPLITKTSEGLYAHLSDNEFIEVTHTHKKNNLFFNITTHSGKIDLSKLERVHKDDRDNPLYSEFLNWKNKIENKH